MRFGLYVLSVFLVFGLVSTSAQESPSAEHPWQRLEVFEGAKQRVLRGMPEPDELEESFSNYVQVQNEKFQKRLKGAFLEAVEWSYETHFKEDSDLSLAEYVDAVRYALRKIQVEQLRSKADYYFISLKVVFRLRHQSGVWKPFRDALVERYEQLREADPETKESEHFWEALDAELDNFERIGESLAMSREELKKRTAVVVKRLRDNDLENKPFRAALKIAHELTFGDFSNGGSRFCFDDPRWERMYAETKKHYADLAEYESREFIIQADRGHLRDSIAPLDKVRFSVVQDDGQFHLVAKGESKKFKTVLFAMNSPHRLNDRLLSPDSKPLTKYAQRQGRDTVVIDLANGGFRPMRLIQQPSWWNPKKYWLFLRSRYEPATWGTAKAAAASVAINGGIRTYSLHAISQIDPGTEFSWPALVPFYFYMAFCAAYNQFYDNLMASNSAIAETIKKIAFVTPFTLFYLANTQIEDPALFLFAMSMPINVTEKLGSTYNRRLIRYLDKEKMLVGDFKLKLGHLNPLRWAQFAYYVVKDGRIFKKANEVAYSLDPFSSPSVTQGARDTVVGALNPLNWVKTLSTGADIFNDNIEMSRPEDVGLLTISKPVGLRELEGYGRNAIKTASTTVDPAVGFPIGLSLQVLIGEISNVLNFVFVGSRIKEFEAKSDKVMTDYYQKERSKIAKALLYVPGLGNLFFREPAATDKTNCRRGFLSWLVPGRNKRATQVR